MASPQKENGYTAIANEIMDALCRTRISGEERQILDCILRKTYGWHKCEDAISLTQFVTMTGINKPHVIRAIHGLLLKNIISVAEKGNEPAKVYKFIKDYNEWIALPKKVTLPKKAIVVAKNGNLPLPKMVPTKETITKETITKDKSPKIFIPPTEEDVKKYCDEKGYKTNPIRFVGYYQSIGWLVGKKKMIDWKGAIRGWEARNKEKEEIEDSKNNPWEKP